MWDIVVVCHFGTAKILRSIVLGALVQGTGTNLKAPRIYSVQQQFKDSQGTYGRYHGQRNGGKSEMDQMSIDLRLEKSSAFI